MADFDETEQLLMSLQSDKPKPKAAPAPTKTDLSDIDALLDDISKIKTAPVKENEFQKMERELKQQIPPEKLMPYVPKPVVAPKSQQDQTWDSIGQIINSMKGDDPGAKKQQDDPFAAINNILYANPPSSSKAPQQQQTQKGNWGDVDSLLQSFKTQANNVGSPAPPQTTASPPIAQQQPQQPLGSLDSLDRLLNPERYQAPARPQVATPATAQVIPSGATQSLALMAERISAVEATEGEEGIIACIRALNNPVLPTPKIFDLSKFGDVAKENARTLLSLTKQDLQSIDVNAVAKTVINTVRSLHENLSLVDEKIRSRVVIRSQAYANLGLDFVKHIKSFSHPPSQAQIAEFERLEGELRTALSQVLGMVKEVGTTQVPSQPSDAANQLLTTLDTLEEQLSQPLVVTPSEFLGAERVGAALREVLESKPFDYNRFTNALRESVNKSRGLMHAKPTDPRPHLSNSIQSLLNASRVFVLAIMNSNHDISAPAVNASKKALLGSINLFITELERGIAETMQTCSKCKKLILSQCVNVGTQFFHPSCLACSICGKEQIECFRFKSEILCEEHYLKVTSQMGLNLICTGCSKPLADKFIEISGRAWHHSCFKCEVCNALITNDFYIKNNKILCESCDRKK